VDAKAEAVAGFSVYSVARKFPSMNSGACPCCSNTVPNERIVCEPCWVRLFEPEATASREVAVQATLGGIPEA